VQQVNAAPGRDPIASAAQSCIGTPYHHLGRLPGVGLDCVGLVLHAFATGASIVLPDEPVYPRRGSPDLLLPWLHQHFTPAPAPHPGDLISFWIHAPHNVCHLAIRTPRGICHVHAGVGRVVEHRIDAPWQQRVHGIWRVQSAVLNCMQ
jgi:cell wall-associated NlpC family hydrolase